jgi:hypothetical protein
MRNINPSKASGPDNIPNRVLNQCADHLVPALTITERKMRVALEGEYSDEATVDSGVPPGTVTGSILFLCHINDLSNSVKSSVRLFADDCLLHREINNENDHTTLQNDLKNLEKWASDWGMRFNAK